MFRAPKFLASLALAALALTPSFVHAAPAQYLDDDAEPSCNISFDLDSPPAKSTPLVVVFDYRDEANHYTLKCAPSGVEFDSTQQGQSHVLAAAPFSWPAHSHLVVQRRPWLVRLLVNGEVLLTAYDSTLQSGKVGLQSQGWTWHDPRLQPVERVRYDDDFTRAGTEGSDAAWTTPAGTWTLTASSQRINSRNAEMSSNPFAYAAGASSAPAFTWHGRWFWDNYDARVSVRPQGEGAVGIASYVQDASNYLLFEWSAGSGNAARQLVRVQQGKRTVLASAPGGYLPRQWYQIGLRTSPGYVEAILDGVPILRARDDSFGQGGVGLWSHGVGAVFDDVRLRSYDFYRQDFRGVGHDWTPENGAWTAHGGAWAATDGVLASRAAAGFSSRLLVAGRPDWNGYQMLVSAKAGTAGAAGIVTGYTDDRNYSVFRWAGSQALVDYHGRQQFVRYVNGAGQILRDSALTVDRYADADGFARLTARFDSGATSIYAGNTLVEQAGDLVSAAHGLAGLWAQGPSGVSFKDVVIFFPPPAEVPTVAPRMVDDSYMVGWASPSGEWPPVSGTKGLEFWNTGDFFGDADLSFHWHPAWRGDFEVALRADRGEFESGYVVRGSVPAEVTSDDAAVIAWTVSRGAEVLQKATTKVASLTDATSDAGPLFSISLSGRGLLMTCGGSPILNVTQDHPALGTAMAVRSTGFRVHADELAAESANRGDYTFTEAPIDFYTPQGNWSVFSRWPCYGDWSFFGGKGINPMMWSKRTFGGDQVVEMYAHNQMDLPKEVGYSHPGDFNISLAADGHNPASGYSFVVGGWYNTRTRLLRGTQVVAEEAGPKGYFHEAINHNMHWHRQWVYVRAELRHATQNGQPGLQVTLTVDDDKLLTWFDPHPLPLAAGGGRVVLWTTMSSLMVARAKIEAQNLGPKELPTGLVDPLAVTPAPAPRDGMPQAVVVDDVPSALVVPHGQGWLISDSSCGGRFETVWNRKPVTVGPKAQLDMDLKIPAGVRIDAYVTVGEVRSLIGVSGAATVDAAALSIGNVQWSEPDAEGFRHASFALGKALAATYPGKHSFVLSEVAMGALHGDTYRYVGFDGNDVGATYEVRNFALRP